MKRRIVIPAVIGVAALALTGCGGASPSGSTGGSGSGDKLVVWNWGDADEAAASYTEDVKAAFAEAHPDVEVEIVNQPFDQYYTLLGSAIEAGTGPDLALFNGGTQLKSRASSLVPVTDELADLEDTLAGWPAFQAEGETYSAPMFLQGFPIYYNKALFTAAAFAGWPLDRLGLATFRSARRVTFDRCVSPVQVDGDHMPDPAFTIEPSGISLTYVI